MTTTEWAAVAVAVVAAVATVAVIAAVVTAMRTLRSLQLMVETLRSETLPLVQEMQSTVRRANDDLERAGAVLQSAESVTSTIDAASRLGYLAFSNPLIKAMALGAGTTKAYKRLRRGG